MWKRVWIAVACVALVAACSGEEGADTTTTATGAAPTSAPAPEPTAMAAPAAELSWAPCGEVECATLTAPLDHDDAAMGTIDLAVARHRAESESDRIGVLLANPGGPGVAATPHVEYAGYFFSPALRQHFDIVTWDPRGVSEGTTIDCVDGPGELATYDPTPETDEELEQQNAEVEAFAAGCAERSGDLLPYLSTLATVHDMELLRQALGEDEISYFGFEYGTVIGSVYATLYPERVRAMALDSALDISTRFPMDLVRHFAVEERLVRAMLQECAVDPFCRLGEETDPYTAFDDLLASIDAEPLVVDGNTIGLGATLAAIDYALSLGGDGPEMLLSALEDAADGNGEALYATYLESQPSTWEAWASIACLDRPTGSWEISSETSAAILDAAPRIGGHVVDDYDTRELHVCSAWPAPPEPPPEPTGSGAGPILVVGSTGDISTPLDSGRVLEAHLEDAVMLINDDARHGAYRPMVDVDVVGFDTQCVTDAVDGYLIDRALPPDGSVCRNAEPDLLPPGTLDDPRASADYHEVLSTAGPGRIAATVHLGEEAQRVLEGDAEPPCIGDADFAAVTPGASAVVVAGPERHETGLLGSGSVPRRCVMWFAVDVEAADSYEVFIGEHSATIDAALLDAVRWQIHLLSDPGAMGGGCPDEELCAVLEPRP